MKPTSQMIQQIMRTHRSAVRAAMRWQRTTPGTATFKLMDDRNHRAQLRFEKAVYRLLA